MARCGRALVVTLLGLGCTRSPTVPVEPLVPIDPTSTIERRATTCELLAMAAAADPVLGWLTGESQVELAARHDRFVDALATSAPLPGAVSASLSTLAEINGQILAVVGADPIDEATLAQLVEQRADPAVIETLTVAEADCR